MEQRALHYLLGETDPRPAALGLTEEEWNYLGEEMWDLGVDPEEYSEEAYLKARDRVLSGRAPASSLLALVRKYQAEFDQRDNEIALILLKD